MGSVCAGEIKAPGADLAQRGGSYSLIIVLWLGSGTWFLPRAMPGPHLHSQPLILICFAAWGRSGLDWVGLGCQECGIWPGPCPQARSQREKTPVTQRDFLCERWGAAAGGSRLGSAPRQQSSSIFCVRTCCSRASPGSWCLPLPPSGCDLSVSSPPGAVPGAPPSLSPEPSWGFC